VLGEASGIEVLHDRRVPGSRANIDHIAVGPAGVFVIDAKKYSGQIEVRDVGGLFRTDERLYVNGRDRSKLVDGVLGQIEVVREALGDQFADVPVRAVLCFIGCEWGWIMRTKRINGVTVLWPTALPDLVSVDGDLGSQRLPPSLISYVDNSARRRRGLGVAACHAGRQACRTLATQDRKVRSGIFPSAATAPATAFRQRRAPTVGRQQGRRRRARQNALGRRGRLARCGPRPRSAPSRR
jgi:Nuclease-related domain